MKKRNAISPVIATVILVAIVLIAAIAVATWFFGLFGTFTSPATLSINQDSIACNPSLYGTINIGSGGVAVPAQDCAMEVVNTGTSPGIVTGSGPGSRLLDECGAWNGGQIPIQSCSIPPGGSVYVAVHIQNYVSGQQASGYLTQQGGPHLVFTTVLP